MVLQRGIEVPVWGVTIPNSEVRIHLGEHRFSTRSDESGKWIARLPSMIAGGPYELKIIADEIIILTEDEQLLIKNVELKRESLINARKWLLLGCLIGQRAGDLLKITLQNIRDLDGMKIIELKQKKTGKLVAIPLSPDAIEIIESGMPYKIGLEHFNQYSKDICREANINTLVKGKMRINNSRILTSGMYEKWQVVSSHICRRSFATNFYSKIPTSVLMKVTGHSTEEVFMKYIGRTSYDNAHHMFEYFGKLYK
jgi:integrase